MKRILRRLCELAGVLSRAGQSISVVCLIGITLLISYEVISRYLFNDPTGYADVVSAHFLAALVMFGLAITFARGEHVRVDLFVERLPSVWERRVKTLTLMIAIPCLVVFLWFSTKEFLMLFESGKRSFRTTLNLPLWWSRIVLPLGLALFLLQILSHLIQQYVEPE